MADIYRGIGVVGRYLPFLKFQLNLFWFETTLISHYILMANYCTYSLTIDLAGFIDDIIN